LAPPRVDIDGGRFLVRDSDVANWIALTLHPDLISGDEIIAVGFHRREISGSTNAIVVVGRHAAMSYIEGSAAFWTKRDHARLAFDSTSLIVIRKSGKDLS
jgi:hypothetical protein